MMLKSVLGAMSLLIPLVFATLPVDPPYNASLQPFPVMYTQAQKAAQLQAGANLYNTLNNLFQGLLNGSITKTSYTVKPGVYRLTQRIEIPNIQNFKLVMSQVEIITTTNDGSFWFFGPNNLQITGPLYFEADPIPVTQGVIVGTDMQSYIDLKLMDGYAVPTTGRRIMCFTPKGVQLPHYQDSATAVQDLGSGTYRLTFGSGSFSVYSKYAQQYFQPGNLLSMEPPNPFYGGFNLQGVGNLYMNQVYHYASNLIFCQNTQGTLRLNQWMGQRRPNTNRLSAGGWMQCQYDGGSLDMTNSEISYNWDDLTDMNGYMSAGMSGPSANQLYLNAPHLEVGRQFHFYDAFSLVDMGVASIVSIDSTTVSQDVLDRATNLTSQAAMREITDQLALVTMSAPVTGNSGLYLSDDIASRPKLLSIRNTYLHDGLAAGISMHGADSIVATGNTIARSALGCMNSGFTAYWLEGGPPKNVYYHNNTCIDSPYAVPIYYDSPSIVVFTEYTQMLTATNPNMSQNITISGNTLYRPQGGSIELMVTSNAVVSGNTVYDPFFFPFEGDTRSPWVFSAQTSSGVKFTNNVVYRSNSSNGINATNLVVRNSLVPAKQVSIAGNVVYTNGVKDKATYSVGQLTTYTYGI